MAITATAATTPPTTSLREGPVRAGACAPSSLSLPGAVWAGAGETSRARVGCSTAAIGWPVTRVLSGAASSIAIREPPTSSIAPVVTVTGDSMRRPSTNVPFIEPRSSISTPAPAGRSTTCRRDSS